MEETFYPWDLTVDRFIQEGFPRDVGLGAREGINFENGEGRDPAEKYMAVSWGQNIMTYEQMFGFQAVRRIHFVLPFRRTMEKGIMKDHADWEKLKQFSEQELSRFCTTEKIQQLYGPLIAGHERGDYSIRLNLEGFFWIPRELFGIEEHLYAFYDEPELMHEINDYVLQVYQTRVMEIIRLVQPDVVYFMEDLSGKNGPMISADCFEEYVGDYYRQLIPQMKAAGAGSILVDTDGDFSLLIPHFMAAGIEGFLPMDVNAGMDIVRVREQFPTLKFIGSYNKLEIAKGPEAIEREFRRILPVIRQGGYIVGSDHQVAPSTSLENYRFYISRLKEYMKQAGADI